MDYSRLREPHEVPLYVFSVLVNLLIIALIVVGAVLLGFLNALAGDPLRPDGRRDQGGFRRAAAPRARPRRVSSAHPRGHTRIGGEAFSEAISRHLLPKGGLRSQVGAE